MTEDARPYGDTPDTSFESQYKRVFAAAECRTQVQLADVLEVRQSSISDAKRRKNIPAEWRVKLFEKKRVNPEWILFGVGAKYLVPADSAQTMPHVVKVTEVRPPAECSAQDLFSELVRRALQPLVLDEVQTEGAATCLPVKKMGGES